MRASNVLLRVERHEGQVQHDGEPVPVDNEEEGQESVDSGFGNDIGIKAVAEVDGVDVVAGKRGSVSLDFAFDVDQDGIHRKRSWRDSPFEVTVHNREEHLEEEVDGVDQHRQQVEPRFAGHVGRELHVSSKRMKRRSIAR